MLGPARTVSARSSSDYRNSWFLRKSLRNLYHGVFRAPCFAIATSSTVKIKLSISRSRFARIDQTRHDKKRSSRNSRPQIFCSAKHVNSNRQEISLSDFYSEGLVPPVEFYFHRSSPHAPSRHGRANPHLGPITC